MRCVVDRQAGRQAGGSEHFRITFRTGVPARTGEVTLSILVTIQPRMLLLLLMMVVMWVLLDRMVMILLLLLLRINTA